MSFDDNWEHYNIYKECLNHVIHKRYKLIRLFDGPVIWFRRYTKLEKELAKLALILLEEKRPDKLKETK